MSNRANITENLEKINSLLKEIQKQECEVRRLKYIFESFRYDTIQYGYRMEAYWNYRNATEELHNLIKSLYKTSCKCELNFENKEI